MAYQDLSPEAIKALSSIADAIGAEVLTVTPTRVCDHCGCVDGDTDRLGREYWVFPYGVTDRQGTYWQHLCNPCSNTLDIDWTLLDE